MVTLIWDASDRFNLSNDGVFLEGMLESFNGLPCVMSLACKNFHSAEVGAGASGLAKASFGNVSTWVATAKSSRSFRFLDVTIAVYSMRFV